MTDAEQVLLTLLAESLFGVPGTYPADVSWDEVFLEAKNQAVAGLISDSLSHERMPELTTARYQIVANGVQLLHAQKKLVALLAKEGIPSSILKGTAAAIYYPQPFYRTMGDIDIIVPRKRFSQAKDLMEQSGYIVVDAEDDPQARHIGFSKNGIVYELHHHFSYGEHYIDEYNGNPCIDKYIDEGLEHVVEAEINGVKFPLLPRLQNGLVLLDHMRAHLRNGLGLRQVVDWMMYVDRELGDNEWASGFGQMAADTDLDALAVTATRMCQMYLGLRSDITWCQVADESLCQRLMGIILTSGNFGRKLGSGGAVESVFTSIKRNGLFRWLQHAGEHNWRAYKRHKWLKPFCWAYQLGRYACRGIAARRGNNLGDDMDRSRERYAVLTELNIT